MNEDKFDVYEPEERKIYHYFDGETVVRADPMTLWQRLMSVRGDLSAHMAVAFSPSEAAPEAYAKVSEKARMIFALKTFEEGGLTQSETVNLLNHFWNYCDRVKKNTSDSRT